MTCPQCGSPIKTVPAGVSKKTGKAYQAFQACSNRDCTWKPERNSSGSAPVGAVQRPPQIGAVADMLREIQESKAVQCAMNAKLSAITALLEELVELKGGAKKKKSDEAPPISVEEESGDLVEPPDDDTPF